MSESNNLGNATLTGGASISGAGADENAATVTGGAAAAEPAQTITGAASVQGAAEPAQTVAGAASVQGAARVLPGPVALHPVHQNSLDNAKESLKAALAWLEKIPGEVEHELSGFASYVRSRVRL